VIYTIGIASGRPLRLKSQVSQIRYPTHKVKPIVATIPVMIVGFTLLIKSRLIYLSITVAIMLIIGGFVYSLCQKNRPKRLSQMRKRQ
jgi:hypothetical protein